jgi:multidrug efflux system outer membrane protein
MKFKQQLALILLALSAAGCSTLWPEYEKPPIELPAAPPKPVSIDRQWWKTYEDPVLNALVDEALVHNWDLAKAVANVAEARAAVAAANSQLLPRVDGVATAASTRRSLTIGNTEKDKPVGTGTIGIAASWEIDLWDRIGQMNEAALARLASSEHARDAVTLSISSLVVDAWLQLHALDRKLAATRQAAVSLKAAANLENRRWKAGVGTELAYSQAVAEAASTEARIPALDTALVQAELALKLLVGRSPRAMSDSVARSLVPTLPQTPREVDSILLLRRPDVASAEQLLVASHADVNSARAEFYPRLTLSALIGFVTSSSKLISGMPLFWDASAGLVGPIFDGGLVQSRVDAAEARKDRALAHYQYTVSAAFRDTYLALALLETTDRQVASFEEEVATRKRAAVLAERSYEVGRSSKFEVLTEQVRVLNAQIFLIDAKYYQFASRGLYFKALGGGY